MRDGTELRCIGALLGSDDRELIPDRERCGSGEHERMRYAGRQWPVLGEGSFDDTVWQAERSDTLDLDPQNSRRAAADG